MVSDEKGQKPVITDSAALNKGSRHAPASVKEGTKGIEVKLYDKMKALEMLGLYILPLASNPLASNSGEVISSIIQKKGLILLIQLIQLI